MLRLIRTHLAWKVFLSYVVVVLVGVVVLATAASLSAPAAFDRHLAGMSAMMSGSSMMGSAQIVQAQLFSNYQSAVSEALCWRPQPPWSPPCWLVYSSAARWLDLSKGCW